MTNPQREVARYPLLESLLAAKGLPLKGIYRVGDTASIFDVSARTIQDWIREGKLTARDLPGRGRFLSEDLEQFLRKSVRRSEPVVHPGAASFGGVPRVASTAHAKSTRSA